MEKISAYPTHWLETRYPFDAEARHSDLESAVLQYLQQRSTPHIVDVGAGYGANYRYLSPLCPPETLWTLIEHDPLLIEATRQWVPASVRLQLHSLLDLPSGLDLQKVDLLLANAVFDLFSEEQFTAFMQPLREAGVPLYLTLNYTGMGFSPEAEGDDRMIARYEAHMQRPQSFGQAMGAQGPEQMVEILQAAGYTVQSGTSLWQIGPEDDLMQTYLLGFMESAIGELLSTAAERQELTDWVEEKRKALSLGALSMWVSHEDLWAQC